MRRLQYSRTKLPARGLSVEGRRWISHFRYGFTDAPNFGVFEGMSHAGKDENECEMSLEGQRVWRDPYGATTLNETHPLHRQYCKALVYASGGSRPSRDWIAGGAALTLNDDNVVHIALQHIGSLRDVTQLARIISQTYVDTPSLDSATIVMPRGAIVRRCFLYDAAKATLSGEPSRGSTLSEEDSQRISQVSEALKLPADVVAATLRIAVAEKALIVRKFQISESIAR